MISEAQYFRMQESLTANTQGLEAVFRANERTSANLEYMQVLARLNLIQHSTLVDGESIRPASP